MGTYLSQNQERMMLLLITIYNRLIDFLISKSEVLRSYKAFDIIYKIQYNMHIKTLHLDRGREYTFTEFQPYLKS